MKKIYLSVIGFTFLCRINAYGQIKHDSVFTRPVSSLYTPVDHKDTTVYNPRALHLDEVDLVSSYYKQNGIHSTITGDNPNFLGNGIFTNSANVIDVSNGIDLHWVWVDDSGNKHTLTTGIGIDHHTSASSAFVTTTGLGKQGGTRIYPSIDWTVENPAQGATFGLGAYYSGEYNYKSLGGEVHFSKKTNDKSGEFSAKLQGYFDQVTLIYPSEFIPKVAAPTGATYITTASGNIVLSNGGSTSKPSLPTKPRDTYTAAFSYSQIINSRLQVMFLGDVVTQSGYLSLPFHRVYFSNGKDTIEKLPSSRFKIPIGFRLNYFLDDHIILRSYYRYYADSWGTKANTANLEIAYKVSPFFSISPFYRYYSQTASKYFAPFEMHSPTDQYYTSNYEYAKFNSQFFGVGFRVAPPNGVFGWQNLHELEIRYGHYTQTTQMSADVVSLSLGFK